MRVAVVTPTIGSPELKQCMESVQKQTYENITHYIFMDGEQNFPNVYSNIFDETLKLDRNNSVKYITLQDNVGAGWLGHRVYAASSFLVNADIICYLDEDNWLEPCHIEKMVDKIKQGYDWVYSLRKIYDKQGNYLFEDNCESLGKWPIFFNEQAFHIDTSCYALKLDIATKVGHVWYDTERPKAADRKFFQVLKTHFTNFECTNTHSVNYRLGGNPNSVSRDFFEQGNKIMFDKYKGEYPWKNKSLMKIAPGISLIE